MTRLSYSTVPSSVKNVGTCPSGLSATMVWSRATGPAALGKVSILSPNSAAHTITLRTNGEAGEK